jgi:hypothetical protein
VKYIQRNLLHFYPDRPDVIEQAERLAGDLGGKLRVPSLSWKYSWTRVLFGFGVAKRLAVSLRKVRWSIAKRWDRALFLLEGRRASQRAGGLTAETETSLQKPLA